MVTGETSTARVSRGRRGPGDGLADSEEEVLDYYDTS